MKTKFSLAAVFLMAALLLIGMWYSAMAAPGAQGVQYVTPTPGTDGRIIYVVKSGDTCTSITMMTGVTEAYLRQTNHLDENCTLMEGQSLVIGIGGPAAVSPTSGLLPTATLAATATPQVSGSATICVALFNDVNGDGMRQADTDAFDNYVVEGTEPIVVGGAISVASLEGPYSQTLNTIAGLDPVCFSDVPGGKYSVSAAVPDGFNATTVLTHEIEVSPGDSAYVNFGSQLKVETATGTGKKSSPLLGALGGLLLLGGIGLGVYAWRVKKTA